MFPHPGDAAPKVRWCWLAREAAPPPHHHCKHLSPALLATLGGCLTHRVDSLHLCLVGKPQPATSLRGSSESEDSPARIGVVGLGSLGGLQHPPVAGLDLDLSVSGVRGCHDIQERAATLGKAVSGPF
ncbi:hypothetical protein GWK47_034268 [Chionoecetes opilio]|uniref:Uncharacterized protein n=1 Tax=Chionoecetes opilio TaxID=41210 RepID=A0A8J5CP72_CHIOP|nr:hypothetical protein GWK47_034268 [Chionoecetes opilio]